MQGDGALTRFVKAFKASCRRRQAEHQAPLCGVEKRLYKDLKGVEFAAYTETGLINAKIYPSDSAIGQRLFYLFQKDLLPGVSGRVLEFKSRFDTPATSHVYMEVKAASWAFLVALNVGMLFYILLFASSRSPKSRTRLHCLS